MEIDNVYTRKVVIVMKRNAVLTFLFALLLVFSGCSTEYDGWKKVPFEGGSFMIPGEWNYYIEDEQMFIEKDGEIIMNQVLQKQYDYFDKHKGKYHFVEKLEGGTSLSNTSSIEYTRYLKDEKTVDIWSIDFFSSQGDFWIWSDEISYDMMYKIANSYVNREQ